MPDPITLSAVLNGHEQETPASRRGLVVKRFFTQAGADPFDMVPWEKRTASIQNEKGQTIFEQPDVEVPSDWSMTATNIVASKYFHGKLNTPERESSVRGLISRVADTIADWGREGGYFRGEADASAFHDELVHLLVRQMAAFNSPVWFNCGLWHKYHRSSPASGWYWDTATGGIKKETEAYRHPQCSACFINSIQDSLESILTLAKTEGMLFKWGSGTGTNLSPLRSSLESLSGGGVASGPLSFMKGFDAFAGVIKSGGKTRRAAKMVILNIDHPDVVEFIECKAKEERKAWALVDAGYDSALDGEAYSSIFFQNANNSVRVTDEFMQAVVDDREWSTHRITDGQPMSTYRARDLMRQIADAAWQCGDPGMQYDTTVNKWHTSKNTARINASNPCSEYMFLDDSACNLASLNLMKFVSPEGRFDVEAFRQAVEIVILAQEIIVDNASYPTERIAQNSHDFRPLGLGYANLGALLMTNGLPYDSDAGRDYAGAITAVMHGQAYLTSSAIAAEVGPCAGFAANRDPFLSVIAMHRQAVSNINARHVPENLMEAAKKVWDETLSSGIKHGYRNAQVTVLAPTGTIGFMMDCDTTGIEPDLALVKYKKLVGGGLIKIVNNVVPLALLRLGYSAQEAAEIVNYIDLHGTIEGAPHLKTDHLPVFDCSLKPANGKRSIHYMGHIKMMAAVQPFISGAISKTVNLPEEATPDDIMNAYIESWRLGLKAMAVYRDGSKRSQPLNTASQKPEARSQHDPVASAQESAPVGQKPEAKGQNGTEPRNGETASVPSPELWRLGARQAAGREGSKRPQAANAAKKPEAGSEKSEEGSQKSEVRSQNNPGPQTPDPGSSEPRTANPEPRPFRKKLPDERHAYTHKFSVGGHEGYLTVGLYENGQPGEIFITMAKEGSTVSGLMDSIATAISLALQYGVPLKVLCDKFSHTRFEPSGWSRNPEIGYAKSLMDYIFRWLALKFLPRDAQPQESTSVVAPNGTDVATAAHLASQFSEATSQGPSAASADPPVAAEVRGIHAQQAQLAGVVHEDDAPTCSDCGAIMVRNGACFRCMNCGSTSGCS
ncbi:MAG TPA: vitamin B12-dependent ribonucleotide reductase [Terriglobia bacterium]|nr:vitamin B12-dependent ribonucleotide reductase [Terriglobia bacterium]